MGTSSILAWVKVVCYLHYQVLHAKQPWRKLVSGFSFACNKYPLLFTDDKSNDSSMREGIQLDALNWFGRGYELHTLKSVGREGSKAWALSVVPHFSLSPPRHLFFDGLIFMRARLLLALLSLRKNGGLLVVYANTDNIIDSTIDSLNSTFHFFFRSTLKVKHFQNLITVANPHVTTSHKQPPLQNIKNVLGQSLIPEPLVKDHLP